MNLDQKEPPDPPHIKRDVIPVLPRIYRILAEEAEKLGLVIIDP